MTAAGKHQRAFDLAMRAAGKVDESTPVPDVADLVAKYSELIHMCINEGLHHEDPRWEMLNKKILSRATQGFLTQIKQAAWKVHRQNPATVFKAVQMAAQRELDVRQATALAAETEGQ